MASRSLDGHRATLQRAKTAVERVRGLRAQLRQEAAKLSDGKFSDSYRREHLGKLREAAKVQAAQVVTDIKAEVASAMAERDQWTREAIVRRAAQLTSPAPAGDLLTSDQRIMKVLGDILELQTASHWRETAREMTPDELVATFADELPRRHFAIAGVLLREAERRAATAGAGPEGMDVRTLPRRLHGVLEASDLPEFAATDALFHELRLVNDYLDGAVTALDTGHDAGLAQQRIVELRAAGKSNEEINAAMVELRAREEAAA